MRLELCKLVEYFFNCNKYFISAQPGADQEDGQPQVEGGFPNDDVIKVIRMTSHKKY